MSLNINDIVLLEQLVRVCQLRGAIKPEEMVEVGQVYNKLKVILDDIKKDSVESTEEMKSTPPPNQTFQMNGPRSS
jgi:hypothetical protein